MELTRTDGYQQLLEQISDAYTQGRVRAVQAVKVGSVQNASDLQLDLAPFFEKIDWAKRHSIMSPSVEAVRLSEVLAKSFSIHAK